MKADSSMVVPVPIGSDNWELFLVRLRYREGPLIEVAGNHPVQLVGPENVWIVFAGSLDVFSTKLSPDGEPGARQYLFSAETGSILFGVPENDQVRLLASSAPGTKALKVRRSYLQELTETPEYHPMIAMMVNNWLVNLIAGMVDENPPQTYTRLFPDRIVDAPAGEILRARKETLWAEQLAGHSIIPALGLSLEEGSNMPMTSAIWLDMVEDGQLRVMDIVTAVAAPEFWEHLDHTHRRLQHTLIKRIATSDRLNDERARNLANTSAAYIDQTFRRLSQVLTPEQAQIATPDEGDELLRACQIIGETEHIDFTSQTFSGQSIDPLNDILKSSHIRARKVSLEGHWYQEDAGSLLGFWSESGLPVALIRKRKYYELHDTATGQIERVTEAIAKRLEKSAYTFYRPFLAEPLSPRQVLQYGLKGAAGNIGSIIAAGAAVGAIGLATPIMIGELFNHVIPFSQHDQIFQIALALVVSAVAGSLFTLARNLVLLRFEIKTEKNLQAAVIDRLLNLPTTFYRKYTSGDLGQRAMSISLIRSILSRTALDAMLTLIASLFSFIILFFYSLQLAIMATFLSLGLFVFSVIIIYLQIRYQRELAEVDGRLSGAALQIINGIAKLRIAGAEHQAFTQWARQFTDKSQIEYRLRLIGAAMLTFNETFAVVSLMGIFALVAFMESQTLSTGTFLAFNAAFTQFVMAALGISSIVPALTVIGPLYERVAPILEVSPEGTEAKYAIDALSGQVEVDHVTFRYLESGPVILDNVSLHFDPGEFVALVGPSGSGKSTVVRLLLGFDMPEAGTILYDGQDLNELDVRSVRRQIGTVLQHGRILTGDIFSNIVGALPLTIDDAWEAAEMAGLAEDIRQMPMGMYTLVAEGGGTLSGGQRQRLMIARALVNKPRIVIFDEATSALDNRTQEIVGNSLEALEATRIVIAHRLSTIQRAHRIYVMQNGQVAQHGSYRELMTRRGPFAELAKRQLT